MKTLKGAISNDFFWEVALFSLILGLSTFHVWITVVALTFKVMFVIKHPFYKTLL